MDRYVVIGNPVSHSQSPKIHAQFSQQTEQAMQYEALLAEKEKFPEVMEGFFSEGGKGANITVPFKQEAFTLAQKLSLEARTAGAVNTLYLSSEKKLCGHNTDGIGLVKDILDNNGGSLSGKKILLLGAGGATRGILQPLLKQQPTQIHIANRTASKAEGLAESFVELVDADSKPVLISGGGFNNLDSQPYDWIINATSASLQGELPVLPSGLVMANTWCYDLMYSLEPTLFCQWAKDSGAGKVMDGLGMLVEQAAESFQLWRGIRPHTKEVIALLKNS